MMAVLANNMAKNNHQHRPNASKRDLILLTILLRLRIRPSVPYPLIASIMLTLLPTESLRLIRNSILNPKPLQYSSSGATLNDSANDSSMLKSSTPNSGLSTNHHTFPEGEILYKNLNAQGRLNYLAHLLEELFLEAEERCTGRWVAGAFDRIPYSPLSDPQTGVCLCLCICFTSQNGENQPHFSGSLPNWV